jgi:hypothetical protein
MNAMPEYVPPERKERKPGEMKKFIRRTQEPIKEVPSSDDDDAPKNNADDFGNYEEEVVPVQAKPFLFEQS